MDKILILGGTTWNQIVYVDHLPEPKPATLFATGIEAVGSTGAGKALSMTRLGLDNTLHSILGNDEWGAKIIKYLADQHVDFIYDYDHETERHVDIMDKKGGRISIFVNASSADCVLDMSRLETMIQAADLIVLNIIGYTKQLIPLLKKYQKVVWTDLHDYQPGEAYYDPFIEISQAIFFSTDRLPDFKPQMRRFIAGGKRFVVATQGKSGATLITADQEYCEPAIDSYRFVDANGAGDAFFSGFLYSYLHHEPLQKCLRYATIAGGVTITDHQLFSPLLSPAYLESTYQKIYEKRGVKMSDFKDFANKLHDLGIKAVKSVEKGYETAKLSVENTILEDNLKRRFNLENPYRFEIYDANRKSNVLTNLFVRHAKRYDEDDLFVFSGAEYENSFKKGGIIKDLSDNAEFMISEIQQVLVPVEFNGKSYEIVGTAVKCKAL